MNNTKTQTARGIIAFWHMTEFLTQGVFPEETPEDRWKAKNAKRDDKVKHFTRFLPAPVENTERKLTEGLAEDARRFPKQPLTGELHFCVGKIARESLIQALYRALNIEDNRPEEDKNEICLLAFKTNTEGFYIQRSLHVSPVAWGVYRCSRSLDITREAYDEEMASLEKALEKALSEIEPMTQSGAYAVFSEVWARFLEPLSVSIDKMPDAQAGALIYDRYRDQTAYEKYAETAKDYSALLNSFYLDDLDMVKERLQNEKQDTPMLKSLIDYIVSGVAETDESSRVNIRDDRAHMENCLRAANSPMGKWPSKHAPALMQQIAVNMGVHIGEYRQPIFSVNGPPGTGKTTLLKEIIASNVVYRAKLLCEYKEPDDAFGEAYFQDGECRQSGYDHYFPHYHTFKNKTLADYSMLVASCNNAAVENITKELPDGAKLLKDLQGDDLAEIAGLFDISRTEESEIYKVGKQEIEKKDIYFSYPAQKLLGSGADGGEDAQWGLISAPMGKMSNVHNYYNKVLNPILESQMQSNKKTDARIARYAQSREDFLAQYETVAALREALDEISRLPQDYQARDAQYVYEIEACLRQIASLREERVKQAEKLRASEKEPDKALTRISEAQARLDECLAARNVREAKILEEETKIKIHSDRLMDLEGGRGLLEILFGKWLKTERYRQICELKSVVHDMLTALAPLKKRLDICETAVSKAESELRSRRDEAETVQKTIDGLKQKTASLEQALDAEARKTEAVKKARGDAADEYRARLAEAEAGMKMTVLDDEFWKKLAAPDDEASTEAQLINPWITDEYNRAREKLFYLALRLHKDFVLSSKACRSNFINLGMLWKYRNGKADETASEELCRFSDRDKNHAFPHLLNTLFLLTPVFSTTFASVGRFLKHVQEPGALGTLIIDEAGQVSPHMALGALWRCRRAIVVGDPKQVEPVVTGDVSVIKRAVSKGNELLDAYRRDTLSVQEFADRINRFGATLPNGRGSEDSGETWVGCPLVVHRRCVEPMFGISNRLSYGNTMKLKTVPPQAELSEKFILEKSCWLDVKGNEIGSKNHFVEEQGKKALELITDSFRKYGGSPDLFVISPFTTVINGLKNMDTNSLKQAYGDDLTQWLEENCGTVHRFQGKEAGEVIFFLGCDANARGAVRWVKPNILNVAATRAKYRLYIIGDADVWRESGIFQLAYDELS